MDLCMKATSSNTDNMVDPPTLSWLSDSIPEFHQGKRNVTISELDPSGCDLEPTKKTEIYKNIDKSEITETPSCEAATNVVVLLTTKKVKQCHMKMANCNKWSFLLDAYQELMDIDSDLTMTGTITSIPRKHASWRTIL